MRPKRSARGGFTLLEATISAAIVAIMIGAGLSAVTQSQKSRRLAEQMSKARAISSSLLEEIAALAYSDPQEPGTPIGPDTYEDVQDRFTFDDVDDFDGLMLTPITDRDATWLTDDKWVATFRVVWVCTDDPSAVKTEDTSLKRIEVTLSFSGRDIHTASMVKSRGWEALQ
jgi:type II secretory pathway pseudopilin PulG